MSTRRDKEAEELLNRLNRGETPPPIASRVGKFIFFPRGPISRVVGTLLFRIIAGATVGSAALFVVSIGALVAGVWLGPSDKGGGSRLLGLCGIALAIVWTFANFRRWAAAEREVRHIEDLADEYMKGGVSSAHIVELMERLRHRRLSPDQFERLAIVWKGMQDAAAGSLNALLNENSESGRMVEAHIRCRVAAPGDAAEIFGVLAEVAPEIPLLLDTVERREAVSRIVGNCIATGDSWVATDGGGAVAGFILVEPDEMERFQRDNDALRLRYAGVVNSYRRQGVFRALVQQVMKRKVPLTATVKAANRSQMAALLKRIGFQKCSGDPQLEEDFRWQPG
jgi:ribosomal protein S18 acetylase RimI-like enzyme